ncbi:type III secretion system inner membrane ring lipoprotein SctJ [Burkholderia ubonensis]|uniref:type III secretion system inner membrane ring lipoprotein SctJ n=1 Tax=Burkholderia ubonensis TaxID=101571 RepID=UPI0008FDAAAA|nr:type III secretion inner membrane ring lipoprotein SctJ [Burkholderia ubonensis]
MKRLASFSLLPVLLLLGACHQQELLKDLSERQANDVVAVLQMHDLSVRKEDLGKSGYSVNVDQADFPAAADLLRQYNLPSQSAVDIAHSFPANALVASPLAEQARLLSAVEQRLEQNLSSLPNVVTAHVQISYPLTTSAFGKSDTPMHVAALLTYRNDVNEDLLVSEVKRFVKNSFTNIDYDDISVVLYRAPSLFHGAPPVPAPDGRHAWLYWLTAIPAALAVAAAGALVYLRRRRAAMASTSTTEAADTLIEESGTSDSASEPETSDTRELLGPDPVDVAEDHT